jgi:2-methylcitrate dehydratase PrpD
MGIMKENGLNQTEVLANFVVESRFENLPGEVIKASKKCLLDWIGVTLSGAGDFSIGILIDLIEEMGGQKQATILGYGKKTNLLNAALVNGTASHILDYDDAHEGTRSHPSAPLIPALLSISEYKELSGAEYISAFVLGVEVSTRIGLALGKSYYNLGWHATPILGRFGAAAGVGRLLNLNAKQLATAFGLAATNAGGLRRTFGTMGKSFHAGKAAMDGMLSALLSQRGFTAPVDVLDGESSFLEVFSREYDSNQITQNLGKDYQVLRNSFKPYAACLLIHPVIDGLIRIREKYGVNPNSVERVDLEVAPLCLKVANRVDPRNVLEGKFSIYFCAALALAEGQVKESQFNEGMIHNDLITGLKRKINATRNDSLEESEANVRVQLKDGIQYSHYVDAPKGDPRNPLSFDDIIEKFKDLARPILSERRTNQIIVLVQNLEKLENFSKLIKLCRFNSNSPGRMKR